MKCNVREIAQLSDQPCVIEGRLNYKKVSNGSYRHQAVFKERWYRLINNYLFYFKISEMGKFDTKCPAGVFVMENSSIQMEHGQSIPFSFSISFLDEPEKRHVFAARAEDNVIQWVIKLRECSYEYLRSRLHTLQSKIYSITGKDPLLLVPRNEGACLWAPSEPFSAAPACTLNTNSFSCHLHTNGGFTLERSKSDVLAHNNFKVEYVKKATFYTNHETTERKEEIHNQSFALERSKTSQLAAVAGRVKPFDGSIFDNRPVYSRAAPSPPARARPAPRAPLGDVSAASAPSDVTQFAAEGRSRGGVGILETAPVPPRRRASPRLSDSHSASSGDLKRATDATEDLIQW